jgi:DNA-directed RNA polymerase sigma subunit (sigma70/sigma32)
MTAIGRQRTYQARLNRWAARRRRMRKLHRQGKSLASIGRRFGVTRQRVLVVVKKTTD